MHPLLLIVIIPALTALYLFLIAPGRTPKDFSGFPVREYAHRGLWNGVRPENSLSAFNAAVEKGYGIETDVRLSADGTLFLFHDDTLERMTGEKRKTDGLRDGDLKALRLKGSDEDIPTLDALLSAVNGRVPLILEIKPGRQVKQLCASLAERLKSYPGPFAVESFDPRAVRWFKKNAPEVFRGQLVASRPKSIQMPLKESVAYWVMDMMVMNVLGRPHFLALDERAGRSLPGRLTRLFNPVYVAWTVRSPEKMLKNRTMYDCQIFEGFEPQEKHRGSAASE